QLKIAQHDQGDALACLFEMSCINPGERDADYLRPGGAIDFQRFQSFCNANPKLVRRLHDYLGYKTPKQIIDFLGDNHKVLSRYQLTKEGTSDDPKKKYELKENFDDQFPVFLPVGKEGEEK